MPCLYSFVSFDTNTSSLYMSDTSKHQVILWMESALELAVNITWQSITHKPRVNKPQATIAMSANKNACKMSWMTDRGDHPGEEMWEFGCLMRLCKTYRGLFISRRLQADISISGVPLVYPRPNSHEERRNLIPHQSPTHPTT